MRQQLLLLILFTILQLDAQTIPDELKPPSWNLEGLTKVKANKLPGFNLKALQDEDAINDKDKSKPYRFGYQLYVDDNLFQKGQLTELPNGDKIWRLSYTSNGAFSLNFVFDVFKLPEGGKLYVYNEAKDDLLRPFTHYNNNPEEVLGTWMVNGNTATIEYHQPANVQGEAKLVVGGVVHGYRTGDMFQKALNDSGPCNQDVDCDITPPGADPFNINQKKEDVKAANAMMIVGGSSFCSGTLINNTNNDGTPYFLTANHCGGGEPGWAFRFNWRSNGLSCGTFANSGNGPFNQTLSGATFRASSSRSDMKLVEINDTSFFVSNASNLVWAGWNRSKTQLPSINFGIHHPSGDIQKVCRDDQGALRTVIGFNGDPNTQIWRIADWDLGVTEPGSSGSALYNQDGHIIGLLSGGLAACSGTNDNGTEDWYGRFGVAWDFGGSPSSRLDFWLDPAGTNPTTLDQFPPLQIFNNDARVSAENSGGDCVRFEPDVTLINQGALDLTSAIVEYQLDSETPMTVNWTGTIAPSESEVVANPVFQNLTEGPHVFTVTVSSPNGVPDQNTFNDTFVLNFVVESEFETNSITLNLLTDNYGNETTWEVTNGAGSVIDSGGPYGNATSYQEIINLPVLDECYTFTLFDSFGDGICCGQYGDGDYSVEDENGNVIISGGVFGSIESVTFKAVDALSIEDFDLNNQIKLYPNPVSSILTIKRGDVINNLSYRMVNTLGQEVMRGDLNGIINTVSLENMESGIYFIVLESDGSSVTKKIVKN